MFTIFILLGGLILALRFFDKPKAILRFAWLVRPYRLAVQASLFRHTGLCLPLLRAHRTRQGRALQRALNRAHDTDISYRSFNPRFREVDLKGWTLSRDLTVRYNVPTEG